MNDIYTKAIGQITKQQNNNYRCNNKKNILKKKDYDAIRNHVLETAEAKDNAQNAVIENKLKNKIQIGL